MSPKNNESALLMGITLREKPCIKKDEIVTCLSMSIYGRMKMSLLLRRRMCVYTEFYITEQRSTGCSLSRHSNKLCPLMVFLLFGL
jgi:hypothetical protein